MTSIKECSTSCLARASLTCRPLTHFSAKTRAPLERHLMESRRQEAMRGMVTLSSK